MMEVTKLLLSWLLELFEPWMITTISVNNTLYILHLYQLMRDVVPHVAPAANSQQPTTHTSKIQAIHPYQVMYQQAVNQGSLFTSAE